MKKEIIFIFVEDYPDWESAEALYFITMLGGDQYKIRVAGMNSDPIRSISGVSIVPDCSLEEVIGRFQGIVLVGGIGWTNHMTQRIAAVRPLIEDAVKRGCPVGGVGTAADILGTFGILNHAVHTGNSSSEMYLVSDLGQASEPYDGEALFREAGAIRNGNIITARNTSGLAFARAYAWALDVDQAKADALYEEHREGAILSMIDADNEHQNIEISITV